MILYNVDMLNNVFNYCFNASLCLGCPNRAQFFSFCKILAVSRNGRIAIEHLERKTDEPQREPQFSGVLIANMQANVYADLLVFCELVHVIKMNS